MGPVDCDIVTGHKVKQVVSTVTTSPSCQSELYILESEVTAVSSPFTYQLKVPISSQLAVCACTACVSPSQNGKVPPTLMKGSGLSTPVPDIDTSMLASAACVIPAPLWSPLITT